MYFKRHLYKDKCWWCGSEDKSKEHKYKKAELKREYGSGYYGGGLLRVKGGKDTYVKSSDSKLLKFKTTLCKKCNNQRSQSFDYTYDIFQKYIKNNAEDILKTNSLNFRDIAGKNNHKFISNLLRYYVKHICCRFSDSNIYVEKEFKDFLEGNRYLPFIRFQFEITTDTLAMQNLVPGLKERGHFSMGELACIMKNDKSGVRDIKSYYQYRWFRVSYACDLKIRSQDTLKTSQILKLVPIKNSETYKVYK